MNWLDFNFWLFGPISIWFLGGVILLSAIVWFTNTNKIIHELKQTTAELKRGATELEGITSELRKDTTQLKNATAELNDELRQTRKSSEAFHKTIQRLASFWFPYRDIEQ